MSSKYIKKIRITVSEWSENTISGHDGEGHAITANYAEQHELLYADAQVNLLLCTTEEDGTLTPQHIVIEPDYLIDITTLCSCFTAIGIIPEQVLLRRFLPSESTSHIQLGNIANQFIDSCVNASTEQLANPQQLYTEALQKCLHNDPLNFCTTPDIDRNFFDQCWQQFQNIYAVVTQQFPQIRIATQEHPVQLEPSFLCEALGLQGRMDILSTDLTSIVELKSGKQEEYPHPHYRYEQALQMALYKEILYFNLDRQYREVDTYLLYSRYPQLYNINLGRNDLHQALAVRNSIVYIDRQLRLRPGDYLRSLTEQDFNPTLRADNFYTTYYQPKILQFLETIQQAEEPAFDYFCTQVAFTFQEQYLGRMGDARPDSDRGFAQVWRTSEEQKLQQGSIIIGRITHCQPDQLRIQPAALRNADEGSASSFRLGDAVMLYPRTQTQGPKGQIFRCTITEISTDDVCLSLIYPVTDNSIFSTDCLYVIEPLHNESGFTSACRGLYAFLCTKGHRRDLLLGIDQPLSNPTEELHCPMNNQELNDIISRTTQAQDYYLLVGPPGTGKTSVALRSIVNELLHRDQHLLLMAYTNRAVDEICQMLETLVPAPDYLRIGNELTCDASYRSHLLQNKVQTRTKRQEIMQMIQSYHIVVGTVSTLSSSQALFQLKHFHTALLDEASQVLQAQFLPLLFARDSANQLAIDRFVLIGDHKQLPAVVMQSERTESLFERLHRQTQDTNRFIGLLRNTGRMHQQICRFVSDTYYNHQLGIVGLPHQIEPLQWQRHENIAECLYNRRMAFVDVQPRKQPETPKVNTDEAEAIAMLAHQLYQLHVQNGKPWDAQRSIGIIVPFRGQITAIRHALTQYDIPNAQDITIDTVERYQGSQRDVILFSTVISRPYQTDLLSEPILTEGQWVDRKLNVAITRARSQFIMVGNKQLLERATSYLQFLEFTNENY